MIHVFFTKTPQDTFSRHEFYDRGESTITDENGWIYILDADGLTIGAHPRDRIDTVKIYPGQKAGETTVTSDNSKDGN